MVFFKNSTFYYLVEVVFEYFQNSKIVLLRQLRVFYLGYMTDTMLKWITNKKILIAVMAIAVFLCNGCSTGIVSFPPAKLQFYTNQDNTASAVKLNSAGICLITKKDDFGIILGSTERFYYLEGTQSNTKKLHMPDLDSSNYVLLPTEDSFNWIALDTVALQDQSFGLALRLSGHRPGITIGCSSSSVIRLPSDRDNVLYINTNNDSKPEMFLLKGDSQ